jgi:hypothetical protein
MSGGFRPPGALGDGRHMLVPRPLHVRVVGPTFLEPAEVEPECSDLVSMAPQEGLWGPELMAW